MWSKELLSFSIILILALAIPALAIPATTVSAEKNKIPVIIMFKDNLKQKHLDKINTKGGEVSRSFNIVHGLAAKLTQDAINELKTDPDVLSIDQDIQVKALDINADTQIRANQIWAAGDNGQTVPVAILDTGLATSHPEFSGRVALCHSEMANTTACEDQNGHGTHVVGIVGAAGSNPNAKGVAPSVTFYIDQVLDSTGSGTVSGLISGIDWAVANHAKIITMSVGTGPISTTQPNCDSSIPSLSTAVNNAVSSGITVVAAAGNSGISGVGAPACISSTIAVGAVDSTNTIASFSSQGGPMTDHGVVAPGTNIFSSWLSGGYTTLSGTSMATPHVTGTIALLLNANSSLSPAQIKTILFNTACTSASTPSCPTGSVPNPTYGHGRIDALAAFNAVTQSTLPKTSTLSENTQDMNGKPITGFWTTLRQNGVLVSSGFSPITFTLNNDVPYTVTAGSYHNIVFDHWLDTASTVNPRPISITANTQLTAVYRTATISLNNTSGPVGATVTVSGTNFDSNSAITIKYDGASVTTNPSTITSSPTGTFSATFSIPASMTGSHNISAVDTAAHSDLKPFNVITALQTSTLTETSQDMNGNTITGLWTTLRQNGVLVSSGFSPITFTLNNGVPYTVTAGSYHNIVFDHWLDTGSTINSRPISVTANTQLTAVYRTS